MRCGRANDVVGDPETVDILLAPRIFARDAAEVDVDFGSEARMSMSPYDTLLGASIGVAMWVKMLERSCR